MKKRDFTSAFENDNTINTGLGLDDAIHGAAPKLDTGRIIARPISIFEIYPDPTQPRRAIPSSVRQGWDGDPRQVENALSAWLNAVERESRKPYDLDKYLNPHDKRAAEDNDDSDDHPVGPMEAAFQGLVDLTATIYRDGLTNPITVAPMENVYRLETGERRWLAYHLLHAKIPDGKWEKIPARVVDVPNVWRQAAENNTRDNLNAIGKARQYAILLMDLWSRNEETSIVFKPFESFENEREFYAQVADKDVPKGKNMVILSVMGVEHRNASSRYKALLRLPDEVWRLADDFSWPERKLRPLVSLPTREAVRIAQQWLLSPMGDNKKNNRHEIWDQRLSQVERHIRLESLKTMSAKEKEYLSNRLAAHRAWLDEIEHGLR